MHHLRVILHIALCEEDAVAQSFEYQFLAYIAMLYCQSFGKLGKIVFTPPLICAAFAAKYSPSDVNSIPLRLRTAI